MLGRIVFVFIFFNFVIEIMLDQITINKFIAGDVKAFERLFRKYARSMQLVALDFIGIQLWQKMLFRKFCVFVEPSEGDEA